MAFERTEFMKSIEASAQARARRNERDIQQTAQAEVPMTALTGMAEWDFFLSILQAQLEMLEESRMVLQDAADSDPSFAYEDLARLKAQKLQVAVQISTLRQVCELPKQIIEKGESARLVLEKYVEE